MRELPLGIKNERRLKSLTGLGIEKYEILLQIFSIIYSENKAKNESPKELKRKPGGGRKPSLPTIEIKLLFVLYYLKAYPTFDVLGDRFGMACSTANIHLHLLMPLLQLALEKLKVIPKRSFESPEELQAYLNSLGGVSEILIDVTEREHFRYQDSEKRDALYSGKKKRFTVKNTVITTVNKFVLFLGLTTQGSFHDYALLKEEFSPKFDWFEFLKAWVDLGYLGMPKDYKGKIQIPHKKPRKSKKKPNPQLTTNQKEENTEMSRIRIFVENAIAGIKRYAILNYKFRNKKENFDDDVIAIAAGLWNFKLTENYILKSYL